MRVTIKGRPKHVSTRIAKEALEFFASLLMSSRLVKSLSVEVRFVKDMTKSELGRKYGADASDWAIMDYKDYEGHAPKKFVFEISREIRTEQKLLECLAHEMVHVKQYARKEFDYTRHTDVKRWKGNLYNIKKTTYWFWPWEVEAYGKEIGLVSMFIEANHKRLNLPLVQSGRPTTKES
jgi:hypothetical protein